MAVRGWSFLSARSRTVTSRFGSRSPDPATSGLRALGASYSSLERRSPEPTRSRIKMSIAIHSATAAPMYESISIRSVPDRVDVLYPSCEDGSDRVDREEA